MPSALHVMAKAKHHKVNEKIIPSSDKKYPAISAGAANGGANIALRISVAITTKIQNDYI
jgi:hypothetical protein